MFLFGMSAVGLHRPFWKKKKKEKEFNDNAINNSSFESDLPEIRHPLTSHH